MCGRFASARKRQELLAEFRVERDRVTESLEPDYNVAPTKQVYAVLTRGGHGGSAGDGDEVARELRAVRWGLVPSWAKDPSIGSRLINARAETVDTKPAFRRAFTRRRCLLPADGFYEWQQVQQDQGRSRKQPYYIRRADGRVLAFASLYEIWRDTSVPEDHPRAWLWTAAVITTRAHDEVGRIHDRMPMVIEPGRWARWLDPGMRDVAGLRALLTPAVSGGLVSSPVSTEVNSVRHNGPALIRPLTGEDVSTRVPSGQQPGGQAAVTGTSDGSGRGAQPARATPAGRRSSQGGDPHSHPVGAPLTLF